MTTKKTSSAKKTAATPNKKALSKTAKPTTKKRAAKKPTAPQFFDRELSWIEFNARVLSEALQPELPPLEQLKFLSIVSSNFDEFFMVRVSGVKKNKHNRSGIAGLLPGEVLERIGQRVREIVAKQYACLMDNVLPAISSRVRLISTLAYTAEQQQFVLDLFDREIFPTLTPLRIEPDSAPGFVRNLVLHILFELQEQDSSDGPRFAIVPVPKSLDRFCRLPADKKAHCFTLVEDVITTNAAAMFPGYEITDHLVFRVTRDADLGVDEEDDEDFVAAMAEALVRRQHGSAVRLETAQNSPALRRRLLRMLELTEHDLYVAPGPVDLKPFMDLAFLDGVGKLRDAKWRPKPNRDLPDDVDIFDVLRKKDVLLHHPYDSFEPVIRLLKQAAVDPAVLAIKITLYRTSGDSPIISALAAAAANGKQVTALLELKARFDEEQNIAWVEQLERVGVIVIYGIARLKVHSKACMVVRREEKGIRRYVHLGTGNYNDKTARLYVDLGLLTSRDRITFETAQFFNAITGYSSVPNLQQLVMAPVSLKRRVLSLVAREAKRSTRDAPGRIVVKINSLSDPDVIKALYEASQAGVKILLNVRGICQLVPGVKGLSENIEVVSIVDSFLEHSRILYFQNAGSEEIYLSSADWMPRNLERRIELMFPIEDDNLKKRIINLLGLYARDNCKAHVLQSDGRWERQTPKRKAIRVQQELREEAKRLAKTAETSSHKRFTVRRKPPK